MSYISEVKSYVRTVLELNNIPPFKAEILAGTIAKAAHEKAEEYTGVCIDYQLDPAKEVNRPV